MRGFQSDSIIIGCDDLKGDISEYLHTQADERNTVAAAYSKAITEYSKVHERNKVYELQRTLALFGSEAQLVSLESIGRPGSFVAHAYYLGILQQPKTTSDCLNATFEMVPGLVNGDLVSFRSVNVPNHYLVHGDFRIRLQKEEDSDGYRRNGTFKQVKGLASANNTSFESANYPSFYIRAKGDKLFLEKDDGSAQFHAEATFSIRAPRFLLTGVGSAVDKPVVGAPNTPDSATFARAVNKDNLDMIAKGMSKDVLAEIFGPPTDVRSQPQPGIDERLVWQGLDGKIMVGITGGKVVSKLATQDWPVVWPMVVATPPPTSSPPDKPGMKEQKAVKTLSGLQYMELKVGDGTVAKKGDNVTVHYTGWLKDGTKFDSSVDRMSPFSFQVGKARGPEAGIAGPGGLIRCWDEAVAGMKEGGKRKLNIPADLGLGNSTTSINGVLVIPPNAELQLEVELLKVK